MATSPGLLELLGLRSGTPGINANPNYGRGMTGPTAGPDGFVGYDKNAALFASIAGLLQGAGAGLLTAPRDQAVGGEIK